MSNSSVQKDKIQQLSPLERATFALKKLDAKLNSVLYEPIAIIGMGCSFPGGASTPEKFWELLHSGTSSHTEIPASRWDINSYYDPDRETAGKMVTRYGNFINGVDQFDPGFFGISPREATAIDPQHRLLLEVSWQALERAGQKVERLASEPVGVFVGNDGHDYEQLMQEHLQQQPDSPLASYTGTGNSPSSAAGRLAYTFGFTGPTVTIDTACSSSLVAIHQACNSIRLGECSMAIAGGVKLHLTPQSYILTSRTGMISPDGRCKTFDISADGYGRGEGCGMVVLKSLSQAQAEGDQILAVIRGSSVNQDGPSSSLTVPNGQSQQKLIKKALKQARLEPADISYLEAHGTGTSLGDPIEVNAAAEVFGQERSPLHPLWIGTVKTNIGHLESAAGVSGLIKVVLSLQHQQIPAHLHLQEPNPKIDWQPWLQVPQALTPWVAPHGRFAGVSSFGFTGTNAHVVLGEAPPAAASPTPEYERPLNLLQLSAKNDLALAQLAQDYGEHLQAHPEQDLRDICFTANSTRLAHTHRLAVIVGDREELQNKLSNFGQESFGVGLITGQVNSSKLTKVAMLFTGQGSQYVGMGRQLYHSQPTFKKVLDQCAEISKDYLDKPLLEILYGDEASENVLAQTAYTQVALFAIEYALYKLWQSWGIKPSVVMGHSVGEYVAATVAGVLSLEEGLKLIAHRGRLMQQLPPGGEMLSVMASVEQINQIIAPYSEKVAIAAINGAESVVISGESEALATVKEILDSLEIKTKQLQVSHGFHSHLMEPMLADFKAIASEITYNQPIIPLLSNVTGVKADESIATPDYWVNHLRQPVKFAQSMATLHQEGYEVFLEIGPKPTLLGMGRQCLPEDVGVWLPSLRPSQSDWQQMLQSLGELYVRGVKVDWLGFDQDYHRSKVTLPTYPFQRQRYWIESSQNIYKKQYFTASQNIHPLLGEKLNCAGEQAIFASFLSEDSPTYLRNHRVFNQALFPTTAYLEMAVAAGSNLWGNGSVVVEELSIKQGLILAPGELVNVQTVLTPSDNKSYQLQIFSQREQDSQQELEWVLHATALIRQEEISKTQTNVNLKKYQDDCSKPIDVKQHYQQCSQTGIDYGSSFQGIEKLGAGKNQALASIKLPEELIGGTIDYQMHPALLDAALQVSFDALPQTDSNKTYLQVGVEEFKIYGYPGLELWAYASVAEPTTDNQESWKASVILISPEGEIVASIKGLEVKLATKADLLGTETESITDWLYEIEWRSKGLLGRLGAPDFLLKPAEIAQKLTPDLRELVAQIDDNSTSVLASSLQQLSVDYIVQGLRSIGWSYSLGETFDSDAAAQHLGVVPSQVRLFKRLLQILSEMGILESREQQWQVRQTLDQVNATEKNQSLLRQFPDEGAALTLLERCASQLGGVLRGTVDPVQLVFPQGDLTTAAQLYEDSRTAKVMNTIVQKAITQATEKLPPNRGIRLLEIGAGTGGTTSYVLPHLNPNQAQYIFTDIGRLFTGKAQEKFQDYQFLDYQTLDIELDPTTQGFESHSFDVIIAANVLHATTNIKETLSNVKQLLAPGGMLVLYEGTTRTSWVDLIFGLLEGWWKFQDYELRPDYPLLSRSQWKEVLAATGFTEVATLPEMEGMPQIVSEQAVIVASAPQTIEPTASTPKNWLLLADDKGVAQQLARQLNSEGDICTLVFPGSEYQQISPTEFTINPHNPSEYEQLIGTLATSPTSVNGVVQCWSTASGVDKTINSEQLEKLSFLGCGTTLSLVQALVKGGLSQTPRLWLVTCGSQAVTANNPVIPGVAQSSLWGMGKVISLEHPEFNCVRIDLDPCQSIEEQAQALFNEIWSQDREDQVAWRGDSRYVARLVPSPSYPSQEKANTEKPLSFHSDVTYLITGGTGGLGLLVADWMVSKGAKNLVLVGRSSPDAAAKKKLTELEMTGATVLLSKADVSDVTAMRSVLHKIENSKIPLAGIIHSAGMLSDGVLANQTWSSFEKVMAAKVQGAWHLHQLTQNQPLDFFVLFSSTASLLGSPGQGNHSAANGFLDGLAHYRQAMGLPGLSINWGAVAQVGEAAQRGADVRVEKRGIGAIPPQEVSETLELLMGNSCGSVGVVPIRWSEFIRQASNSPFFADFRATYSPSFIAQSVLEARQHQLLERLKSLTPSEKEKLLRIHLQGEVANILGMSASQIDVQQPLNTMGLDSLAALELKNRLQTDLGVDLPIVKFMEDISTADLVTQVNEQLTQIGQNQRIEPENNGQLHQTNEKVNERISGKL